MSKFRDLATRIKINPETYIKFDGTETLLIRNIQNEDGVGIKYDILLVLYEMVNWITVGDLIAPWPLDDQDKIMTHLEMLASRNIIVTSQEEVATVNESGLSEHLGRAIHINVENHHAMLRDSVRMAAYRRAIESAVNPETIALDLGCGTGILSFFTASAGAQKVFAIERRSDIIFLAQQLAAANGFAQRIEFIEGASSQLPETRIQPKADLLVAEILGNGILEENVLEFTIDARRRFLKPGAAMIPYALDIYFFAFDAGHQANRWQEVQELNELYGYDFNLLGQVLCGKATTRLDRYHTHLHKAMSAPVLVRSLDFRTLEDAAFSCTATFEALEDGQITSFCGYFKAHLDEKNLLTNSPWAPSTHWTQLLYTLAVPKRVKQGDRLELSIIYDGALRVYLKE
jgi:SAM-dependent methyltransferase